MPLAAWIFWAVSTADTIYFVRDNGTGSRWITPDDYPGMGIGLATFERLIQRLGGRVWAQSAPGQGATFYFTLDSGN